MARIILTVENAAANLSLMPVGASADAQRMHQAQRRERISRGGCCEQCNRELCLPGDFLGPRCRNLRPL